MNKNMNKSINKGSIMLNTNKLGELEYKGLALIIKKDIRKEKRLLRPRSLKQD